MRHTKTAIACFVTALVIPAAVIAAWYLDPTLIDMYRKFDISSASLEAWRIGLAAFSAIASLWIGSRALKHRKADTISLAVGLVICLGLVFIAEIKSLISDVGLLIVVLTCSYVGALVMALVGKRSE